MGRRIRWHPRARRSACCLRGCRTPKTEVVIAPGDCLVLCSDGVTDAQNLAEEEFGETRLAQAIADVRHRPAEQIVSHVFEAVDAFAASAPQFDDITLMVVRRDG